MNGPGATMSTRILAVVLLFSLTGNAATTTRFVGTATVRGNMRLDGNQISSDATLFDGTRVETSEASAMLNVGAHSVITMSAGSLGIVHEDNIKLEQGQIDVKPTCGFVVEADQVRITPNSLASHSVIAVSHSNVSLKVLEGEFLILDSQGRVLSKVHSGNSQSIGAGQGQPATPTTYAGTLSVLDRHPMLTLLGPDNDTKYEVQGRNAGKVQGRLVLTSKLVLVDGTIDPKRSSFFTKEVISSRKETAMCAERAVPYPLILGGAALAATAAAIAITNQPSPPASR